MRQICSISLLLMMLCITEAWADVVLIMRREAEASGNYVRICDIARVEGPKDQANEVASIVLGPTPPRGQTQEITRWDIQNRLFEMGIMSSVTFTGNDMVRVFGDGARRLAGSGEMRQLQQHVPGGEDGTADQRLGGGAEKDSVLAAGAKPEMPAPRVFEPRTAPSSMLDSMSAEAQALVGQAISRYLAGRYRRADMEIEAKLLSVENAIADSAHEVKVEAELGGHVPGKATLRVSVKDRADAEPRTVVVDADTQVFGLAPVASRPLARGESLTEHDVLIARVKMEAGKGYLPPNPKAVVGRSLKRNLKPGEPVLAVDAALSDAVKRGNLVVVVASGAGWEVKTIGKALGGGMPGEMITVEDSSTKAKYPARITGPGTVAMINYKDQLNKK